MMNPAEFANIARTEETFWWFRGMQRILFRILQDAWRQRPNGPALEIGGGTGYFAAQFAKQFEAHVVLSDFAAEGLQYARRRGLTKLIQCDARHIPVRDSACGVVFCLDMLVHLHRGDERSAVRELARVLRPGGWLVIRVAALKVLRSRHSQFTQERHRFTRTEMVREVEACGLRVERATYLNSLLLPVAFVKFRIWEPLLRTRPRSGLEPVTPWLNKLLEAVLRLEEFWIGLGRNFGLGQSVFILAWKPDESS